MQYKLTFSYLSVFLLIRQACQIYKDFIKVIYVHFWKFGMCRIYTKGRKRINHDPTTHRAPLLTFWPVYYKSFLLFLHFCGSRCKNLLYILKALQQELIDLLLINDEMGKKIQLNVDRINTVKIWKTRKAKCKRLSLSIANISRKSLDNWSKPWADIKSTHFWCQAFYRPEL